AGRTAAHRKSDRRRDDLCCPCHSHWPTTIGEPGRPNKFKSQAVERLCAALALVQRYSRPSLLLVQDNLHASEFLLCRMWEVSLQGRVNLCHWVPVLVPETEPHSLVTLRHRPDQGVAWLPHGICSLFCPVVRLWKDDLPRLHLRLQAPDIVIKSEARKTRIEKDPILR